MRRFGAVALLAVAPAVFAGDAAPVKGIETGDLDRSVAPCTDLDAFANGAWRAANPIPPSMVRWSRGQAAREEAKEERNAILVELSASTTWPRGSVEQRLGDHYAACMDEARIEALGLEPVRPLLAEIDGLTDIAGVQGIVGRLHALGIPVPFGLVALPDARDPARVIAHVTASGLGLPDRGHYLNPDPVFQDVREKYRVHVAHMIELGGASRAASRQAAEAVFAMERLLAAASLDGAARREPKATDHLTSFVDLTNLAPNFDWPGYFAAAKLPRAAVNVQEPEFLGAVDRLFLERPLAAWKAYLKWHLLRSASPFLSSAFVKEAVAFEGQYLLGTKETKPRWKRCVESTDEVLGEALGRRLVAGRVPPVTKAGSQEIVRNLLLATGDAIRGLDGAGPKVKTLALERLARLKVGIGASGTSKDDAAVPIGRDTLWANVAAARQRRVADERARIGKPAPPDEIVLPVDLLRPPSFSPDATDAVNYGALGMAIGHEISRRFDRLAGARIAYGAFLKSQEGKPPAPTIDGFSPEQQFFVAWAQFRGEAVRPEAERLMVSGGPPPAGRVCVDDPLSNILEFQKAFGCPADAPMARPPGKRCEVW